MKILSQPLENLGFIHSARVCTLLPVLEKAFLLYPSHDRCRYHGRVDGQIECHAES